MMIINKIITIAEEEHKIIMKIPEMDMMIEEIIKIEEVAIKIKEIIIIINHQINKTMIDMEVEEATNKTSSIVKKVLTKVKDTTITREYDLIIILFI